MNEKPARISIRGRFPSSTTLLRFSGNNLAACSYTRENDLHSPSQSFRRRQPDPDKRSGKDPCSYSLQITNAKLSLCHSLNAHLCRYDGRRTNMPVLVTNCSEAVATLDHNELRHAVRCNMRFCCDLRLSANAYGGINGGSRCKKVGGEKVGG